MSVLPRALGAALSGAVVASGLALVTVAGPLPAASAEQPTSKVVQMQFGSASGALLTSSGDIYSWGINEYGQTGLGVSAGTTATPTKIPAFTPPGQKVVEIAMSGLGQGGTQSETFGVARTNTGAIYVWGSDRAGGAANGALDAHLLSPTLVSGPWGSDTPVKVANAAGVGIVITQSGHVYTWGKNASGQTGQDNGGANVQVPGEVTSLYRPTDKVVDVVGGSSSIYARTASGVVLGIGDRSRGRRGDGYFDPNNFATYSPAPTAIPIPLNGGESVVSVGSGTSYVHVITSAGRVFGFGFSQSGRLGDGSGTTQDVLTPIQIPVTMVDAGDKPVKVVEGPNANSSLILTQQGHLYAAGSNSFGVNGLGLTSGTTPSFTKITSWTGRAANDPVVDAGAGSLRSYAVTASGIAYIWGSGASPGGLGTGDTGPVATPKILAEAVADGVAPTITGPATATGTVGTTFGWTPTVTGDPAPTLALTGALPAGLSFSSSTGAITGTPTATGSYPVTVTATNASGASSTSLTITVGNGSFTISAPTVSGTARVGGSLTCAAAQGTPGALSYAWTRGATAVGTGATYSPSAADLGSTVTCTVTATRPGYGDATASASSATIASGSFTIDAPTVSGTARVGGSLTCAVAQGTPGALSYAWTRGATAVGTGATYSPSAADLGSAVTCTVTATRPGYGDATASASSATIASGTFTIAAPTVTGGPATVDRALTCAAAPGTPGVVSYSWTRGSATVSSVAGYTPAAADLGATLTCTVTAVRDGYADATNAVTTAAVAPGTFSVAAPTIEGTPQVGVPLSCVAPEVSGTVAVTWFSRSEEVGTGSGYTPEPADAGAMLRCVVTVSRAGYTDATSEAATDEVALGTFTVAAPQIGGEAVVGQQLTCAAADGPGSPELTWYRGEQLVGSGATYDVVPADLGEALTCGLTVVRAGYEDAVNDATSAVVVAGTFTVGALQLGGFAQVGRTLTCAVPQGPGAASYTWYRGEDEVGTGPSYDVVPADAGSSLRCAAVVTRAGYEDVRASADTAAVELGTFAIDAPAVSGTAVTGSTLTCAAAPGSLGELSYAWFRGQDQVGAGATYELAPADVGGSVRCVVTATRAGYEDAGASITSAVVGLGTFTVATPTVTGDAVVGQTLTCAVPGGPGTPSYEWRRGAETVGSDATYTLGAADLAATLTCVVTVARAGYEDATASVERGPVARGTFVIAAPSVTGLAKVGETLVCGSTDHLRRADGTTYAVRWLRGDRVLGTDAAYTATPDDLGAVLTCELTGTRAGYVDAVARTTTSAVAPGTLAVPAPAIAGTLEVGRPLTASVVLPQGATVAWQWFAGGRAVAGATERTYSPTVAQYGVRLTVRATVTLRGYADTAVTSAATSPVDLRPLGFKLGRTSIRPGTTFSYYGWNLRPGQRWVLRFGNGDVLARGTVPAGEEKVDGEVKMPPTNLDERWIAFETTGPDRMANAKATIL